MNYIKIKEEKNWLHVALNRPKKKNALDLNFIQELKAIFQQTPPSLKGVFLTGEGSAFCAGADLHWIRKAPAQELQQLFDLLSTIQKFPRPVIAHVHGFVYGGGIGLIGACDFVSAEKLTQFCFSEARLGLVPAVISFFVSPQFRNWMLSSKPFNVDVALKNHLIHFEGSQKECAEWKKDLVFYLEQVPSEAYQDNKSFLSLSSQEAHEKFLNYFQKRLHDPITQEKIDSLLKKR